MDHWLYNTKNPKTRREAWEDILMLVNYQEKKVLIRGQLYDCGIGQSLLSLDSWAIQFNWTKQQVRTFFSLLENHQMITLEGLQYTTRLTVCNYDIYIQSSTRQQHTKQHTDNTPTTHEKSPKKKKEFIAPTLEEVKQYFYDNGYKTEAADKFYKYYTEGNWKASSGKQVKNWKQKAQAVWFTEENKDKQNEKNKSNIRRAKDYENAGKSGF